MHYRRFGKTELWLSVFSLGTMRCLDSQFQFEQTLAQAISQGINHIETAQGYGKSEQYLGNFLQNKLAIPREKLYITTKIPPTSESEKMLQNLNKSLENLQLDYLDCLAIHGINTKEQLEWIKSDNGCFSGLKEAQAQGKIKHIGFSTHGTRELIIEALETDFFEFINLHYYYFFQRHQEVIELAAKKDMGIFIISPADKGGRLYTPSATLKDLCQPFSPLELNYRFLLSNPLITTLSLGAAKPEELREPLQVAEKTYPLTKTEKEIINRLENQLSQRLGTDCCRQCYQCLPCPEAINIPEVLRLRNLTIAYDLQEFAQYRYRMFENAGHWFPGNKANRCNDCGDCLPRCPEQLDIPSLLLDTHQRLNGSSRRRLWDSTT